MHKEILKIDVKSLYYNILNDNERGHTCTVATPIKQGKSINDDLKNIYNIPKQIDFEKHPKLIRDLVKNSKSIVKVNNVFVFDKLKVNGDELKTEASFCFYTKEEIDEKRFQFGRIKLHYPTSLKYNDLGIDNRKVINSISEFYNNYAFIIEGFEFDYLEDSLNFIVLLVGYTNIPYSKVFINNKGVGNKYNEIDKSQYDMYDSEIIALRKKIGSLVDISNFSEYMNNGKLLAKDSVRNYLMKKNNNSSLIIKNIRDISSIYPYSLFDYQYYENEKIHYCLIFGTYTKTKYFNMSVYQRQFINLFDNVTIFLVTDLCNGNNIIEINKSELEKYKVQINSVRFIE